MKGSLAVVAARPCARDIAARPARVGCRPLASVFCSAFAVVAAGLASAMAEAPQAGNEPADKPRGQVTAPSRSLVFAVEQTIELKKLHDAIVALAAEALPDLESSSPSEDDPDSQRARIRAAEADLERATLLRELAELALREYQDAISVHERADAEAAVKDARVEQKRAREKIEDRKEQLKKLKKASLGTAQDLAQEFQFADRMTIARGEAFRADLAVERAEFEQQSVAGFKGAIRQKELSSMIEKTRSEELAKKSTMELERSKLKRLERIQQAGGGPSRFPDILALLDQAIPVEQDIRSKLSGLFDDAQVDLAKQREIEGLMVRLRRLVEQAQDHKDELESRRLKSDVRWAVDHAAGGP
jgi:hypothetical protein